MGQKSPKIDKNASSDKRAAEGSLVVSNQSKYILITYIFKTYKIYFLIRFLVLLHSRTEPEPGTENRIFARTEPEPEPKKIDWNLPPLLSRKT